MLKRTFSILFVDGLFAFLPLPLLLINDNIAACVMGISTLIIPFSTKRNSLMLFTNISFIVILFIFLYTIDFRSFNSDLNFILIVFILNIVFIFLISQVFFMINKIYKQQVEKPPNIKNGKVVLKIIVILIYYVDWLINKVNLILPFIYYVIITFLIIYTYAIIYNGVNEFNDQKDSNLGFYMNTDKLMDTGDSQDLGYKIYRNYPFLENVYDSSKTTSSIRIPILDISYYNFALKNNYSNKQKQDQALLQFLGNSIKVSLSEYMYFSATTFYTVGYGDVDIKGRVSKVMAQSEMFIAGFLNIIFVPLILFVITDFISKKRKDKALPKILYIKRKKPIL